MSRKVILTGIVVLLLIVGMILFLLLNNRATTPQEVKTAKIVKLIDEETVSPIASFDGLAIWYFTKEGHLLRVTADGVGRDEYSLPPISGLARVAWPVSGNDFIAVTTSNNIETKYFYDSNLKKYVSLPQGIKNFAWMPDAKRIIYVWQTSDGKQQLGIANADASGYKILRDLNKPNYTVKPSPNGKDVLIMSTSATNGISSIINYNLERNEFETIVGEGNNTAAFWLPKGERFIFTRIAPGKVDPEVFLFSMDGRKITDLGINTTTDRMVYDKGGNNLYVAVPKSAGAGDKVVKIDLRSFLKEDNLVLYDEIKMRNLIIASDIVFFTNVRDGKMYYISK